LLPLAAAALKVAESDVVLENGEAVSKSDPSKKVAVGAIPELRRRGLLVGVGYRAPNPEGKVINPFAAQFAEVEVNTRTGEVKVLRFLAAHDSGRVMNRLTYDNQVFGGMTMGIGLALTEGRVMDRVHRGKMLNANLHDYKLPTSWDVPADARCIPIDPHDTECNSTGAKGIGEPATIPTAPAIANAIYHATGVRMPDTPVSPLRLCQSLAASARRG
jgi:CO/xanthine dehydrogenase Mo-binding subunit